MVSSFVVRFYFTEVLRRLFLNSVEMDITRATERFCEGSGQELVKEKGTLSYI